MYSFPEPRLICDRLLPQVSPFCSPAKARFGYILLRCSPLLPRCSPCSPLLPRCSLGAPPCSLGAPSKAALLPFPSRRERRGSAEGALRERRGSTGEHRGSIEGVRGSTIRQCSGAANGSLKWLPPSRLELLSLFYCCLDFATSFLAANRAVKQLAIGSVPPRNPKNSWYNT